MKGFVALPGDPGWMITMRNTELTGAFEMDYLLYWQSKSATLHTGSGSGEEVAKVLKEPLHPRPAIRYCGGIKSHHGTSQCMFPKPAAV
jgi:hypothetical protein